mmetsp:Transcript_15356/g.33653  ORF Transcript_15356/g.33653 Transcript_15356/m.33653 type:complete len:119 (-) Transcript_15356:238-594(-)
MLALARTLAAPASLQPLAASNGLLLRPAFSVAATRSFATSGKEYEESVAKKIREALDVTQVKIVDQSGGCGQSFAILVVGKCFEGKSKLQKQRLVQGAIRDEIAKWHAVTIQTRTPEE